ncbi:hypothetical protein [Umezawaea sp. NPDC059074]|uniref:hypothetical protein n=1 Tax=Umezawaea sp. NPDC059074 TaxID=3346716 RepID=UPI0036AFE415
MCFPIKTDDRALEQDLMRGKGMAISFVMMVLTACGTPAPPDMNVAAKRNAIGAYVGMWEEAARAATTSDRDLSAIAQYATDEALETLTRAVGTDRANGIFTRGMPASDPEVFSVDSALRPSVIGIFDCSDRTSVAKYRIDGELAEEIDNGRRSVTAQVEHQADKTWRVTQFAVGEVGTC